MRPNSVWTVYPAFVRRWRIDGVSFGVGLWAALIDIWRASVVSVFASAMRSSSAHVMWSSMRLFSWLLRNFRRAVASQRRSIFC